MLKRHIFIGDIHGNTKVVTKAGYRNRDAMIIQVGDMGIGFFGKKKPPQLPTNCRFIRGNHDNPAVCALSPSFIPDGSMMVTDNGTKIMFIGGARSQDIEYRTIGVDYWIDEEIDYNVFKLIFDDYERFKPDVVVSHDCPHTIASEMFGRGTHKPVEPTMTSRALDVMREIHAPKIHVFEHWHMHMKHVSGGTEYFCIGIDRSIEYNL